MESLRRDRVHVGGEGAISEQLYELPATFNSDEVRIDKGTRHSRRRGVPPLRTMLTVRASARRSHRDRICISVPSLRIGIRRMGP